MCDGVIYIPSGLLSASVPSVIGSAVSMCKVTEQRVRTRQQRAAAALRSRSSLVKWQPAYSGLPRLSHDHNDATIAVEPPLSPQPMQEYTVLPKLGIRPDEDELTEAYRYGGSHFDLLGLSVETYVNGDEDAWYSSSSSEGVIVLEVKQHSLAEENNIRRGDIIIEMGKTGIQDSAHYKSELEAYNKGDTIMLRILRNNSPLYIAFEIE